MTDQLSTALGAAGVPPAFLGSRLADFDPTRSPAGAAALEWARGSVQEPHSGLVAGMVGTGKTMLVTGILAARGESWLERWPETEVEVSVHRPDPTGPDHTCGRYCGTEIHGRPAFGDMFVGVPAMLDAMRRWIARPDGPDPLNILRKARLLVLDDIGREKVTDWATERLYVLVDGRYGDMLPTIATSNLRPLELARAGYEPIVRRLLDGRPTIWLEHRKAASV